MLLKQCFVDILYNVGGIAQLGERLHGMQEVSGSIPLSSTKTRSLSSRGLGHDPFTVGTGVRIPVGTPVSKPVRSAPVGLLVFKAEHKKSAGDFRR